MVHVAVIADEPHEEKQLRDGSRVGSFKQPGRRPSLGLDRLRKLAQVSEARQIFNSVLDDPDGQKVLYERFQITRWQILLRGDDARNLKDRHAGTRNREFLAAGIVQIDVVEEVLITEFGKRDICLGLEPGKLICLAGGVYEFQEFRFKGVEWRRNKLWVALEPGMVFEESNEEIISAFSGLERVLFMEISQVGVMTAPAVAVGGMTPEKLFGAENGAIWLALMGRKKLPEVPRLPKLPGLNCKGVGR